MVNLKDGLVKPIIALAALAFTTAQPVFAEDNNDMSMYVSAGTGGVFYDYGEETDEAWTFEGKFGLRATPYFGTEFTFGGLPDINNRTYGKPNSAKELSEDTSALKYAVDFLFHPLAGPSDTLDPFVSAGLGVLHYDDSLENGKADPFFGMGIGTFYNFTDDFFARADYKLVNLTHDGEWNQHTLLSLGYRWGLDGGKGDQTGAMAGSESEDNLRGRELPLNTVYFAFDSSKLDKVAQDKLTENAKWLKENSGTKISLEGHCDERGTNEYNLALGDRRAQSAKKFIKNLGISEDQVATQSFGEEFPADAGHNEGSWAKNRRVEFREKK